MELHHIGLLVDHKSYNFVKSQYEDEFGYTCVKEKVVKGNVFCFLAHEDKLPYLEVFALEKNILGIPGTHFAYRVQDINEAFTTLVNQGYSPLEYPTDATMVDKKAFLIMPQSNICIELVVGG